MCAWQAYLQLWTNSRGGERERKIVSEERQVEEINFMEMADQWRRPTSHCIMQQKKGMIFCQSTF